MNNTNIQKPWLDSYPSGTSAEIDPYAFSSIPVMMEGSVKKYAQKIAFQSFGVKRTYQKIFYESTLFAAWLQTQKVSPGSKVAIMLPNILQYPTAVLGSLRAGCIVVSINPSFSERELEFILQNSAATTMVVLENYAARLFAVVTKTQVQNIIVTSVGERLGGLKGRLINAAIRHIKKSVPAYQVPSNYVRQVYSFNEALLKGGRYGFRKVAIAPEDIALLQYTSGTTSQPKGVMLSHKNLVANVLQTKTWLGKTLEEGKETIITALPLYHSFALITNFLVFFHIGMRNLLVANLPERTALIKTWCSEKNVSVITGANNLFSDLRNHADFMRISFSGLKVSLSSGAVVKETVADRWHKITGCAVTQAYGLTETSSAAIMSPLNLDKYSPAIGLPLPFTDISIRGEHNNLLLLGAAHIGEICIKGPQVMAGYWHQPAESTAAMTIDGYLTTGDMGYMDEHGFVYLLGRKQDMLIVSGLHVYPHEVENVLAGMQGIAEVGVIGIPDDKTGTAVKAFIIRKDSAINEKEVLEYAKKNLPHYKVPRFIEFCNKLPRSGVGELLRRILQDEAIHGH